MKSAITFALFTSILAFASAAPATIAIYRIEGLNAADAAPMTPERIKAEGKLEWSLTSELPVGPAVSTQFISPDLKVNASLQAAPTHSKTVALTISVELDVRSLSKQTGGNDWDGSKHQLKLIVKPGQCVSFGGYSGSTTSIVDGKTLTTSSSTFYLLTLGETKL